MNNDEIKEMLELHIKHQIDLLPKNQQKVLDYITNLQEKIKHYEETQTFGDYVKEVNLLVDYKSRNEKAVEYIKQQTTDEETGKDLGYSDNIDYEYLLNILNGDNNE